MHPTRRIATTALVAAAALAAAAPAFAGGPLVNCQPGQPFLWPAGGADIPFNPDQGTLGPLTNAQAVQLVADSFQVWADIPTASATHVNAGFLPFDVDVTNFFPFLFPAAPDGLSAIVFDADGQIFNLLFGPGSGILGFAGPEWIDPSDCTILEGVSFLNGPTFTNLTVAKDVMVHEYGHYQNLAHTAVNGQVVLGDTSGPTPFNTFPIPPLAFLIETMYPFYFGPVTGTSTVERDDVAIFSTLYPEPGFFASTGTIAGSVLGPDGGARLSGVNVIARNVANPFVDAASAISSDFTEDFSQAAPLVGTYTINGLTPGADYAVYIDGIFAGGFSTPLLLPQVEEFYNGAGESGDPATDDPSAFTAVTAAAGAPVTGVDVRHNDFEPGLLALGDEDSTVVFTPRDFRICGRLWDFAFINSNGTVSFDFQDNDPVQSVPGFLFGAPRIAGLWTDLDPSAGGTVSASRTQNSLTVSFSDVPEFLGVDPNSFAITLRRIGPLASVAEIDYGVLSALNGLAGVSCGGGATTGSEPETDLVPFGPIGIHALGTTGAVYEDFDAGDVDLSNRKLLFFLLPF
jgi:hypothetical protein